MTAEAAPPDLSDTTRSSETEKPSRATLVVFIGAVTAMFMSVLDMQIVVAALPTIVGEFGGLHLYGWVGSAYLLATAAVAPFYGKLGDIFGRRNVMLTSVVLFVLGSLACGLAWSMESLVAARVLQGLGGGGLMVSAFAVIGEIFSPRERARYQGFTSIAFTAASILGPVAGGGLTEVAGWRWIFLVNLPIGLIVLAVIAVGMKPKANAVRRRIDYLGGILMAVGTVAIVYWGDYVLEPGGSLLLNILLPLVGLAAIVSFIFVERRADEPLVPLHLFRNHTVALMVAMALLVGMSTLGQFFYMALFMQTITGLGPAGVGLLFLPSTLSSTIVSMVVGTIIARTGRYKWFPVVGMIVGSGVMIAATFVDATTPIWALCLMFFFIGIAMGLNFQVMMTAVQAAAPLRDIGAATGLVTQARTVGAGLGLAVNGAILSWGMRQEDARMPPEIASQVPGGLHDLSPAAVAALPDAIRADVLMHYSNGFGTLYWWVAGLYGTMLVLALLLKNVEIPKYAR